MRSVRWLLLATFLITAAAVFRIYRAQSTAQKTTQRPTPPYLAANTKAEAIDFEWGQSAGGKPAVKLFAKESRQDADSNNMQLRGIEMRIYQKDGEHYDRIRSETANFTTDENKLYAPEVAEITLQVPAEGGVPDNLTSIKAGGVNFDSKTGRAVTDQPVAFTFSKGYGNCTGASYDPQSHELHLDHNVTVFLVGTPGAEPMKVESEELVYVEQSAVIRLGPWARLTRGGTVLEAGPSVITIEDQVLRAIDATAAHGKDIREGKQLEYSAGNLHGAYNENGELEKLIADGDAKLVATMATGVTTVTGTRVDMTFTPGEGSDSELTNALVTGKGYLESHPADKDADAKILRSDVLELRMRPGGRDVERVNTHTPGSLEFLPSLPTRHRRLLKSERMVVNYGPRNEVQSFHADLGSTETYPTAEDKKGTAVSYTSSKTIDAGFDARGQLKELHQNDTFRYTEGVRKAQADSAVLDNEHNLMTLDNHAHIADDTGSTTADKIVINQATGDFDASGHVATTRMAEKKKDSTGMLDDDAPTQGMADHVITADRNQTIHYIGNAVLWQASNRLQASRIDIDRAKRSVIAEDKVVSQFQEKEKEQDNDKKGKAGTKPGAPPISIVHAAKMVYTDEDKTAIYTGGVDFRRPTLSVKSETLKAWLNDSTADSRINHAFGDGKVEIVQAAKGRQRVGTGEHAEYYTDDNRIVVSGGQPLLTDTLRGNTRGAKLTYFTDDERLIVDGTPQQPVQSRLRHGKT
jgi:lipopolysaccharide export system protein LptA